MQSQLDARGGDGDPGGANWYAAYVKHQHERKVADLLQQKRIDTFLPQQKVFRRWKDRKKLLLVPFFPGYLFLHSNLQNKLQILSTPGVFFLIEHGGRACPIPAAEIESIRRITEGGVHAQAHAFVSAGDRVRIIRGPLSGVVGILTRFKNQYRVVVAVEVLKKAVSVDVEIENVERCQLDMRANGVTSELKRAARAGSTASTER